MPFAALVLACTVIAVSDGDTLTTRCETGAALETRRIRIAGIDAPEKGQPFGRAARLSLDKQLRGKWIEADCYKNDRYERHVCRVRVGGTDVGLRQVRDGMAWRYVAFEREQTEVERTVYATSEAAARADRRGLWQDAAPIPPWEWRKAARE